jgi:alkylation response protein AidB-like acyl-CoA dehydrogenase
MHERTFATMRRIEPPPEPWGRTVREAVAEAQQHAETYVWYPQRAGRTDLLVDRAQTREASDRAVVRQSAIDAIGFQRANEWTAARARGARALGRPPGPEGSLGKLAASELARRANRAHTLIAGADATASEGDDPGAETVLEVLLSTPAQSIAGGTDEIQRNIIGENVLGLPREPAPDRDQPFREVRR